MHNTTGPAPAISADVVIGAIGPFDPIFHSSVGRYYRSSPTSQQKRCLREFFENLRRGPVNVPYIIKAGFLLVHTCGHIVTISDDGKRVVDLAPDVVQ
jgi:hypothetical protein